MNPARSNRWYADRDALRLIALRYLPLLVALNFAWETAQLPLYTLWIEGSPSFIAYSVVHCTRGDVLIGAAAIAVALIVTRAPRLARWRWGPIALVTTLVSAGYTGLSEWINTVAVPHWAYSELMPVVRAFGVEIGLSPILQWLLLPPLALWFALRSVKGDRHGAS
ncbi:MAG: hypothetical protein ABI654_09930 [Betaproteobacteria bacterium]